MTIYSGQTRISEEEDLWRIIGIHEIDTISEANNDRQIIHGHKEDNEFYQELEFEPDIYYDLITKTYQYKNNDTFSECNQTNGFFTANHFYENPINGEPHHIYYDQDRDQYYIYENNSYREIEKYTYEDPTTGDETDTLYYHNNGFYKNKKTTSHNIISILIGDEYIQRPYVQGLLTNNIFYSDEVVLDSDSIYYNKNDDCYYVYVNEILVESTYEYVKVNDERTQATCYTNLQLSQSEVKTFVEGYKVGNRFFKTVSAGYIDAIVPSLENNPEKKVYYDQLTNSYYFIQKNADSQEYEFVQMGVYEQLEVHEDHDESSETFGEILLYYHNYENENVLHSRIIVKGYFVDGNFYKQKLNGDPNTVYHTTGTNNFWEYNTNDSKFNLYSLTVPYEIGVLYSGRVVDQSVDKFYKERITGDIYYYDGTYHITEIFNAYYIPTTNIMCQDRISSFTEDNENLYHALNDDSYYIYKEEPNHNLEKINPAPCYIIDNIAYKKQKPALGAIYYDDGEYFIYKNGVFEEYDNNPDISDENQIVLSLTKANMILDDNILDQTPYDNDVVLHGATSTRAGLMTADLYNRFVDLEDRYKMTISPTTYATLADLEADAPTNENWIYIVGDSEQYVLSDNGDYVKIGSTDLSALDLSDVASVDDVSDILERIQKQDLNLQGQIDLLDSELALKYPTANIVTDKNNLNNSRYQNEAVGCKALVDYMDELMSGAVTVDHLKTETVVERVEKIEDSIQVYYKDIVTAMPLEYIDDNLESNYVGTNRTYSSRLLKSAIDNLQAQINNMIDTGPGVSFKWESNDPTDATIVLTIQNRVI